MRYKQLWALFLTLALLCSLALPAYAAEPASNAVGPNGFSPGEIDPIPIVSFPPDAETQSAMFKITEERFPDENFRNYLKSIGTSLGLYTVIDTDNTTELSCPERGIRDLTGVGYFENLERLDCSGNLLSRLDLSANTALTSLNVQGNDALVEAILFGERIQAGGLISYTHGEASLLIPAGTALVGFHTVTFIYNDGTGRTLSVVIPEGEYLDWPEGVEYPEREGYEILDWYAGDLNGEAYDWEPVWQDLSLTAKWAKCITVTLDYNGGTVNGASSDSVPFYEGLTLEEFGPAEPSKKGKIFAGWTYQDQPFDSATPFPAEDVTLVASWADAYTLHFDRSNPHDDRAKQIDDITVAAAGSTTASFSYQSYNSVFPPLLNDDRTNGYQFVGWDTDANAAIDRVLYPRFRADAPDALNGPYEVTLNEASPQVTLYAIYGKLPTVTIHKNDGSGALADRAIISRGVFYTRLYIGTFTRSGYDLLGYSTDPNAVQPDPGLEKSDPNKTPNVYYYTTEDVELYAVWGAKRYTLSYDLNGGSGTTPEIVHYTMENKPEIVLPASDGIAKDHRSFLGWCLGVKLDDVNYGKTPVGTLYAPGSVLPASALKASNQTLYAVWQYDSIKVSLDLNGYTGVYTPAAGYPMYYNYGGAKGYDAPAGRPVTPLSYPGEKPFPEEYAAAEGLTNPFCYWMDKETKQFYANGNMTNRNNGTAVLPNGKDTELLGVWKYAFLRYFDAEGAVSFVDAVVFDADTRTYTKPTVIEGTAREGFDFLGWAAAENGPVVYQPGDVIDSLAEISFYPVYQAVAPTAVLHSVSVVFDGLVRLRYYFTLPDALLNAADSYLVYYKNGQEVKRTALKDGTPVNLSGDPSNKSFDFSVVAKAFNDEIVIKVLGRDGGVCTLVTESGTDYTQTGFPYSVRKYADYLKDNSSKPTMRALAKALAEYGDAARIYFGGSGTVSDDVKAVTLDAFKDYGVITDGVKPAGIADVSMSVMFEADNSLRIYLAFASGYGPDNYSFTIDGKPAAMQETAHHEFYLTVKNIAAKNLEEYHSFTMSDGENSFTIQASVLSYARILVSGNKPNSQNLGKALYLYNRAADAYFSKPSN